MGVHATLVVDRQLLATRGVTPGSSLRQLYLAADTARRDGSKFRVRRRSISPPLSRVRFENLNIEGDFDLRDWASDDAAAVLGIEFNGCTISGSILLGRLPLLGFAINNCVFGRERDNHNHVIAARLATFYTDVRFSQLQAAAGSAVRIDLAHCRLLGSLTCEGVILSSNHSEDPAAAPEAWRGMAFDEFALILKGSEIARNVVLRSSCGARSRNSLFGGFNFSGARIGGDLNAEGALFVRPQGEAIRGQGAHIAGIAWLQCGPPVPGDEPSGEVGSYQRIVSIGRLWLLHLEVEGSLTLDGIYVDSGDLLCSINLQNVVIGSNVRLTSWHGSASGLESSEPVCAMQTTGPVWLTDAELKGWTRVLGAKFGTALPPSERGSAEPRAFDARNMRSRGDFEFAPDLKACAEFSGARFDADLVLHERSMRGKHVTIRLGSSSPALSVSGLPAADTPPSATGPCLLRLDGARVEGRFSVANVELDCVGAADKLPYVSMAGFSCGTLADRNGAAWLYAQPADGAAAAPELPRLRLVLDGFRAGFIAGDRPNQVNAADAGPTRLRWLSLQFSDRSRGGGRGLLFARPTAGEFSPSPYMEVARRFLAEGYEREAVEVAKARQYAASLARVARGKKGFWSRLPDRIWFWGFGYFLSVRRAVLTLVICVLLGTVGFWLADSKGYMAATVNASAPAWAGNEPAMLSAQGTRAADARCGLDGYFLPFAFDRFIPFLDLGYDKRCEVRAVRDGEAVTFGNNRLSVPDVLTIFDALFTVLGWVVTSLVILTGTGLARTGLRE